MFKFTNTQITTAPARLSEECFYSNITFSEIKKLIENHADARSMIYILYHDKCQDGMISLCLMNDYLKDNFGMVENYESIAVSYGQKPPEIEKESLVIILDFSYSPETLNAIVTAGNKVVVLDHHVSAINQIANYEGFVRFNYILSKERSGGGDCGSSLMYRFINDITDDEIDFRKHNTAMANVVWLARQQDLWLHDGDIHSDALAFNYGISAINHELEKMSTIENCFYYFLLTDRIIENGKKILKPSIEMIQKIILDTSYDASFIIDGDKTTVKCPLIEKKYASLAGSILSENKPFSITFSEVPDGFAYSLRSRKYGMDVSKIANLYGGGGHTHAAGFISALTPGELFATAKDLGNFQRTVGNAVGV